MRGGAAARVVAAGLGLQLAFGIVYAWGSVVPLVRAEQHWSPLLLSAVFSATPPGYGIGTVAGGRLADRLDPRLLCWAALGLLAAGFAVAVAFPNGLTFIACYAFLSLGVGGGVALTGTVAALALVSPTRAGAIGGAASATYAGSAIFQAPLIGALAPHVGWIWALRAVGLGMALVAAVALTLMPALPARARPAPGELVAGPPGGRLLAHPAVWSGSVLACCGASFGTFAAVNLSAEALARHLGPGLATAAVAMFAVGNAGGRLLAGLAADRFGIGPVATLGLLLQLMTGTLLFAGIGPGTALIAALAAGIALGGDAGSLSRLGADAAPHAPHSAFGLVFFGFTVGAFAGPIAGALVGVPSAWLVTVAPALAGLALVAARARLPRRAA